MNVCLKRPVVNVNVNNLLPISESDFDNSGEPGPQAVVSVSLIEAAATATPALAFSAVRTASGPPVCVPHENLNVNVNSLCGAWLLTP